MLRYRYRLVPPEEVPLAWMARAACRWTAAKLELEEVPPVYFFRPDGDELAEIPRPELESYLTRLETHIAGGPPPERFSSNQPMVGFARDNAPGIYVRADLDSDEVIRTIIHEVYHTKQTASGQTGRGQREAWAHYFEDLWFAACFNHLDDYRDTEERAES